MHDRMLNSVRFMLDNDGLFVNQSLDGVAMTLNRLSHRIRFKNKLYGAIDEVENNYAALEEAFLWLFPELITAVEEAGIESNF